MASQTRTIKDGENTILASTDDDIERRLEMIESDDKREEFLVELERRMIQGYTWRQRRTWARAEYNVGEDVVNQIESLIKHGHRLEMIDLDIVKLRYDIQQKQLLVFQRALEKDNLKEANKALENLMKLHKLTDPVTVQTNIQNNVVSVTSTTRQRVAGLMERMRELAAQRVAPLTQGQISEALTAITDDDEEEATPAPSPSHKNGKSPTNGVTNGVLHPVYEDED